MSKEIKPVKKLDDFMDLNSSGSLFKSNSNSDKLKKSVRKKDKELYDLFGSPLKLSSSKHSSLKQKKSSLKSDKEIKHEKVKIHPLFSDDEKSKQEMSVDELYNFNFNFCGKEKKYNSYSPFFLDNQDEKINLDKQSPGIPDTEPILGIDDDEAFYYKMDKYLSGNKGDCNYTIPDRSLLKQSTCGKKGKMIIGTILDVEIISGEKKYSIIANGEIFRDIIENDLYSLDSKRNRLFNKGDKVKALVKGVSLYRYQKLVSEYISPETPYRGLLVYHGLGSGKTILSISVLSNFIKRDPDRTIIVITPPGLKSNFESELNLFSTRELFGIDISNQIEILVNKKYPNGNEKEKSSFRFELFKKEYKKRIFLCSYKQLAQHLEFRYVGEKEAYFAKNPNKTQYWNEPFLENCHFKKNESYRSIGVCRGTNIDDKNKKIKVDTKGNYQYTKCKSLPDKLCDPKEKKFIDEDKFPSLENCLIIIDEAHKLTNPSTKEDKAYAPVVLRAIKRANDIRVLLLTATPIDKEPFELGILLNLLKNKTSRTRFPEEYDKDGIIDIEKTRDVFNNKFTKKTSNGVIPINQDEFRLNCKGLVSYYNTELDLTRFAKKITIKNEIPDFVPKQEALMDEKILKKWRKERDKEIKYLNSLERPISCETIKSISKGVIDPCLSTRKISNFSSSTPIKIKQEINKGLLSENSNKIELVVKNINENYDIGKQFAYSYWDNEGVYALSQSLKKEGWIEYTASELFKKYLTFPNSSNTYKKYEEIKSGSWNPQFKIPLGEKKAFITMGKLSKTKWEESLIKEIFNRSDNKFGKEINLLIVNRKYSEGITLKDMRVCHILEPPESKSLKDQIIGRCVRDCSHTRLPYDNWNVKIFTYYSIIKQQNVLEHSKSIDEYSETKIEEEIAIMKEDERIKKLYEGPLHTPEGDLLDEKKVIQCINDYNSCMKGINKSHSKYTQKSNKCLNQKNQCITNSKLTKKDGEIELDTITDKHKYDYINDILQKKGLVEKFDTDFDKEKDKAEDKIESDLSDLSSKSSSYSDKTIDASVKKKSIQTIFKRYSSTEKIKKAIEKSKKYNFKKGDVCIYSPTKEKVTILEIHHLEPPYYTILMPDNREKQTIIERLEKITFKQKAGNPKVTHKRIDKLKEDIREKMDIDTDKKIKKSKITKEDIELCKTQDKDNCESIEFCKFKEDKDKNCIEIGTDESLEVLSKNRDLVSNSFLKLLKETSIDCKVFKNANEKDIQCHRPKISKKNINKKTNYTPKSKFDKDFMLFEKDDKIKCKDLEKHNCNLNDKYCYYEEPNVFAGITGLDTGCRDRKFLNTNCHNLSYSKKECDKENYICSWKNNYNLGDFPLLIKEDNCEFKYNKKLRESKYAIAFGEKEIKEKYKDKSTDSSYSFRMIPNYAINDIDVYNLKDHKQDIIENWIYQNINKLKDVTHYKQLQNLIENLIELFYKYSESKKYLIDVIDKLKEHKQINKDLWDSHMSNILFKLIKSKDEQIINNSIMLKTIIKDGKQKILSLIKKQKFLDYVIKINRKSIDYFIRNDEKKHEKEKYAINLKLLLTNNFFNKEIDFIDVKAFMNFKIINNDIQVFVIIQDKIENERMFSLKDTIKTIKKTIRSKRSSSKKNNCKDNIDCQNAMKICDDQFNVCL